MLQRRVWSFSGRKLQSWCFRGFVSFPTLLTWRTENLCYNLTWIPRTNLQSLGTEMGKSGTSVQGTCSEHGKAVLPGRRCWEMMRVWPWPLEPHWSPVGPCADQWLIEGQLSCVPGVGCCDGHSRETQGSHCYGLGNGCCRCVFFFFKWVLNTVFLDHSLSTF